MTRRHIETLICELSRRSRELFDRADPNVPVQAQGNLIVALLLSELAGSLAALEDYDGR